MGISTQAGPPPLEPNDDQHTNHIVSLASGLVTAILAFYFEKQEHLIWTLYFVVGAGIISLFLISRHRRYQMPILILTASSMLAFSYIETEYIQKLPNQISKPSPVTPIEEGVIPEDLEGVVFKGFRSQTNKRPTFVLLTIDNIERQAHRTVLYYSINESLTLTKGQGLVYPSTSTLQLADGTLFRYQKEQGTITLQARNQSNLQLLQASRN